MAAYHVTYQTDLAGPSRVIAIPSIFAMGDNESHTFTVQVYDSRNPEAGLLAGTVAGVVVRPDGGTVPLTGEKGEETVDVTLPDGSTAQATECSMTLIQGCFAYAGQITIVIRLVDGEAQTAVFVARGTVTTSLTDTVVDPGEVVPDIATLLAKIEDCEEAAEEAREAAAAIDPRTDALYAHEQLVEFVEPDKTASGSQSGMAYSRAGARITLNGDVSRTIYIRLYGNASSGTSNYSWSTGNTGCVTLTPGHSYALVARLVTGSIRNTSGGIFGYGLYKTGESSAVGISTMYPMITFTSWYNASTNRYAEYYVPANATDLSFGIYMYCTNKTIAENAEIEVSLYDVSGYNPFNHEAIAPPESVVAKENRSVGNLIQIGGRLFRVTTGFAAGDTITTSYISSTSVAEELAALS